MMTPEQIATMRARTEVAFANLDAMQATIIAQAAEIERLKSCIPWRDGPPPEEWRDGRQVLVWADDASIMRWGDGIWNDDMWCLDDDQITHHAAINKPGE